MLQVKKHTLQKDIYLPLRAKTNNSCNSHFLSVVKTAIYGVIPSAINSDTGKLTVHIIVKVSRFQTLNCSLVADTIKWHCVSTPNSIKPNWSLCVICKSEHFNSQVSGSQVVTVCPKATPRSEPSQENARALVGRSL